jgi:gliding motility-associated-like protein
MIQIKSLYKIFISNLLRLKILLVFYCLFFTQFISFAQVASPEITCLSVANNGNVNINWIPSTNVGGSFVQYNLYSNSSGSFALVNSFPLIGTSLHIHGGAGAHLTSVSYFITAVYFNGTTNIESPALDTLSTIYLNLNNPNDGTAILQWNDPLSPLQAGGDFGDYFYIHQEYPMGTWTLVDSVHINNPNYKRDTISICQAIINYRIELKTNNGCSHFSNIPGDEFRDLIAPLPPIIQNVTVDSLTGNAIITWNPSVSEDAIAYIVLVNISGGWVILDTLYGYNNTQYFYTNSNADLISEPFGIAAIDSCISGNPPGPNTSPMGVFQRTMYARNTYQVCAKTTTLRWNKYINWQSGVDKYEILRKTGTGAYNIIGTTTNDTTFIDDDLVYNQNYCYIIRAISGNLQDSSISNITCRFSNQPPVPNYTYLSNVSVVGNTLDISLFSHTGGITKQVILERSTDDGITFSTIETRNTLQSSMVFSDVDVEVNSNQYTYRIVLKDSCNNISRITNTGRNILLNVEVDNANLKNLLQWSPYQNWQLGVAYYNVYRSVNGIFDPSPIATLPSSQLYYEDDVSIFIGTTTSGKFCYKIEAVETTNTFGNSSASFSNEYCETVEPLVFIPNALYFGGINNQWKPVINLIDFSTYNLRVYTRFGEVIFETTDPTVYWDGFHKGKEVPIGVYIYQVTFNAGNGKYEDFRGPITVIR